MKQRLKVNDLSLGVHLGCTPEERRVPQEVRVGIELSFPEAPPACATDQLKDTICYAQICAALKESCGTREFQTVEKLASVCLEGLRNQIPLQVKVLLRVHKVTPPIEGLLGGVVFELEQDGFV